MGGFGVKWTYPLVFGVTLLAPSPSRGRQGWGWVLLRDKATQTRNKKEGRMQPAPPSLYAACASQPDLRAAQFASV